VGKGKAFFALVQKLLKEETIFSRKKVTIEKIRA
jgi:hypothetical protein